MGLTSLLSTQSWLLSPTPCGLAFLRMAFRSTFLSASATPFLTLRTGAYGCRMSVVGGRTVCLLVAVGPVAMTFQRTPHSISTYTSIQILVWFQMKEAPIHEERHLDHPGSAINITFGQIQGAAGPMPMCRFFNRPTRPVHSGIFWILLKYAKES